MGDRSQGEAEPHDPDLQEGAAKLVPGRSCGTCSLCCTVYSVKELNKPDGQPCPHVAPGRGCQVHAIRPYVCRQFYCSWLIDPNLGPEWKPEVAQFVISADPKYQALTLSVDPGTPLAWKREPYYSVLKLFSRVLFRLNKKVLVSLRGQITIILPDGDVPLGMIVPGEEILLWQDDSGYHAMLRRELDRLPGIRARQPPSGGPPCTGDADTQASARSEEPIPSCASRPSSVK